jgi:alkaline phosphatase
LYDNDGKLTASPQYNYVGGQDTWNQLVSGTAKNKEGSWTLVERKNTFDSLAAGLSPLPKRLIGVAQAYYTLQEARSNGNAATDTVGQVPFTTTVPELSTIATVALRVLSQDSAGFFLMIEGGAIDAAGHANFIARNIEEKMDFNKAVRTVIAWIEKNGGWKNNLLVITGDHETGYLTGPQGIYQTGEDSFDVDYDLVNNGKGKIPGYSWNTGSHTNQLVPLFAKGSCSEALQATALNVDPERGNYTDNAIVGRTLLQILKKK